MLKDIPFFIKLLLFTFILINNLKAEELTIIPLKKPFLDKITEQKKNSSRHS